MINVLVCRSQRRKSTDEGVELINTSSVLVSPLMMLSRLISLYKQISRP